MKERTQTILECGMRYFIETGEPVTSKALFEKYDFGIRPAMIRSELSELCEKGYFTQNHPSGGRIPTIKAYKLFVGKLLEDERAFSCPSKMTIFADELAGNLKRGETKIFTDELSRHLDIFSIGYASSLDRCYESGMYGLLSNLDTESRDDFLDVARDLELVESRIDEMEKLWLSQDLWPQVYIGESPVTKSKQLSVIVNRFNVRGEPFLFLMIGPMRMDYQKSFKILKAIENSM